MLKVTVPAIEFWDERNQEFKYTKEYTLNLEHSLISLSKWESHWHKPFFDVVKGKTRAETIDYIKCMTLTSNVDSIVYDYLPDEVVNKIDRYINDSMTATVVKNLGPKSHSGEIVTSELIYYWMVAYGIPFECEKWHLNRLLTLIEICNVKNQKPKKMSSAETMKHNAALNAARRAKLHSKG